MLEYKGYAAHVELDGEASILHGEVLDICDIITFQGKSIEEVRQAFRESIDDYLELCAQCGEEPEKPFSGRLTVRLSSDLHRQLYVQARKERKSLNQLISERLAKAV